MPSLSSPERALEMVRAGAVAQVPADVYVVDSHLCIYSESHGARCDCNETPPCSHILAIILARGQAQRSVVHHINLDAGNSDPANLRLVDPSEN